MCTFQRQTYFGRLWQEGYYDRVLRKEDATFEVARYVFDNPVKAQFCRDPAEYAYSGSSKYSVREIVESLG